MKILIVRFSSIGDIVLTTPIVRCLHQQLGAEIHYLTKIAYHSILRTNPNIAKIHTIESVEKSALKAEKYDVVIDLHKNLRSLRYKTFLRAKTYSFDKLNFRKWLHVRLNMEVLPDIHLVDRYFEGLSELHVHNDGKGLDFMIDSEAIDKIRQNRPGNDFYCLVLGANYLTKRIPLKKCIEIISSSTKHVVLIGGKDTVEIAKNLNTLYPEKVIDMVGKINLHQSAAFIKLSSYVITGDTGMMHIAVALKKPVKVVWGNTVPAFGMYPYYGERFQDVSEYYEVKELNCRPCSKLGFNACPKGHFKCMLEIDMNDIHR